MMLKRILNFLGNSNSGAQRQITHPSELREGDLVQFGFNKVDEISNQIFEVMSVSSYDYDKYIQPKFKLKSNANRVINFSIEEDDSGEYLVFSKLVSRAEIEELFGLEEFATIFEEGANSFLKSNIDSSSYNKLSQWLSAEYFEEVDAEYVNYYDSDIRYISKSTLSPTAINVYLMEDAAGDYGISVEVERSGKTSIYLLVYMSSQIIENFWDPNSKQNGI